MKTNTNQALRRRKHRERGTTQPGRRNIILRPCKSRNADLRHGSNREISNAPCRRPAFQLSIARVLQRSHFKHFHTRAKIPRG